MGSFAIGAGATNYLSGRAFQLSQALLEIVQQALDVRQRAPARGDAELHLVDVAVEGDVERLAVGDDGDRIGAVQARAVPVQRLLRPRHVGNGDVASLELRRQSGGQADVRG